MGFGFTDPRTAIRLLDIFAIRAWDAVPRIDAGFIPTDAMVEFGALGNGTNEQFVGVPVRPNMFPTQQPKLPITTVKSRKPRPAFNIRTAVNLGPKPLHRRASTSFSHRPIVAET